MITLFIIWGKQFFFNENKYLVQSKIKTNTWKQLWNVPYSMYDSGRHEVLIDKKNPQNIIEDNPKNYGKKI